MRKILFPETYSSKVFVETLRNKYKIDIGQNCYFWSPNKVTIDTQRPVLLHIGDYVKFTSGVTVLCHDYSRSVLMNIEGLENVGESKITWIGDNVFIGINSVILMGAHIGNNTIVGAGSVVSGQFEDNIVIAGNPARKICSIDEYFAKMKLREIDAAKLFVKQWFNKFKEYPNYLDMPNTFSWLYSEHTIDTFVNNPTIFSYNGVNMDIVKQNFLNSKPCFKSFDDFLCYVKNELD